MDLERVLTERLSPLFVSIHATDPDIRARLLRNRRGSISLRWLRALLDGGIEVHGQVVVCPGTNDGVVLDDTLAGVLDRFPELATVACVPLGVSSASRASGLRPHTRDEAAAVCDSVDSWQATFLTALGRRMVFAADEYYLMAGDPFPTARATKAFPSTRTAWGWPGPSTAAFGGDASAAFGVRPGFFAAVDGAPASGYRATSDPRPQGEPAPDRRVTILTGTYGAAVLEPLVDVARRASDIRVLAVANRFFGGNIGVAGLLTGTDLAEVLRDRARRRAVPAARRVPLRRPFPRRLDRRRPAAPGRGDPDRRAFVASGARAPAPGSRRAGIGTARRCRSPWGRRRRAPRPLVVVAGRPNVGKSTLVNRIVGRRAAVVEERLGSDPRPKGARCRVVRA